MPYRILPNQIAILMLLKSEGFQIHQVRNYCGWYHQCKYIVYVFSNFRLFQLLYTMQEMIGSNFWLITVAINLFNFYSPFFAFRDNLQEDKYHWETRSKQKGKVRWILMQQLCCFDYFIYIYPLASDYLWKQYHVMFNGFTFLCFFHLALKFTQWQIFLCRQSLLWDRKVNWGQS